MLNMSYTFKFKNAFENQKCALKNIKSTLFLFSAPHPFLSPRETMLKERISTVTRGLLYYSQTKKLKEASSQSEVQQKMNRDVMQFLRL